MSTLVLECLSPLDWNACHISVASLVFGESSTFAEEQARRRRWRHRLLVGRGSFVTDAPLGGVVATKDAAASTGETYLQRIDDADTDALLKEAIVSLKDAIVAKSVTILKADVASRAQAKMSAVKETDGLVWPSSDFASVHYSYFC